MDWDGVLGSVASVINTALPLFFGAFGQGGTDETTEIGPATMFSDGGAIKFGNFNLDGAPIMINFASAPGDNAVDLFNFSVQLNFPLTFDAEEWIAEYTYGTVTVGKVPTDLAGIGDGPLQGLWTFLTQSVLGVGGTITAVVNPSLSLNLNFNLGVNKNVVYVTAIGAVAALGITYMITAKNNSGQSGTRSGTMEAVDLPGTEDTTYTLALPTGIDFSLGVYGFQLQLPIELSSNSTATDPRVKFETVSAEKRAQILSRKRTGVPAQSAASHA